MSRNPWTIGICVAVVLLMMLGTASLWAQSGKAPQPFSLNHTSLGISQFLAGQVRGNDDDPEPMVLLMNPNNVGMIAAVLLYDREDGGEGGGDGTEVSEVWEACAAVDLTKHDSVGLSNLAFGIPDTDGTTVFRRTHYAEVIAAPRNPVTVGGAPTRLADGLGIVATSGRVEGQFRLLPPDMFSLPANSAVDGQREAARTCICDALDILEDSNPNVSEDTFAQFPTVGVCPTFGPPAP